MDDAVAPYLMKSSLTIVQTLKQIFSPNRIPAASVRTLEALVGSVKAFSEVLEIVG